MMAPTPAATTATATQHHRHPPYKEMILKAVASLNERSGSSRRAISKYVGTNYTDLPPTNSALLGHHLRRLKKKGHLRMIKNSYKLTARTAQKPEPADKKLRGRPPKIRPVAPVVLPGGLHPIMPRKPGQPSKASIEKPKPGRLKKVLTFPEKGVVTEKRKPGRPRKVSSPTKLVSPKGIKRFLHTTAPKRKPGRPKKVTAVIGDGGGSSPKPVLPLSRDKVREVLAMAVDGSGMVANPVLSSLSENKVAATQSTEKRKPGRPKKVPAAIGNGGGQSLKPRAVVADSGEKRKRGRPKGIKTAAGENMDSEKKKPVGRPKKNLGF